MAAEKQYEDARTALGFIEQNFLPLGKFTTYGEVCKALGYKPSGHARHIGQVCSLIDAACWWAKLPFLSAEKVRMDNGGYNTDSFAGDWAPYKDALMQIASTRIWTSEDIGKIRSTLNHLNGEAAVLQWQRIEGFGKAGKERALRHA